MQVNFKKLHPDAVIPTYGKEGDAGLDLTAISAEISNGLVDYGTGLAVEIPEGYVGLIFPRSSIFRTSQILSNSVGVIDSGYRGEIRFMFYTKTVDGTDPLTGGFMRYADCDCYEVGNRIGQLVIMPYPKIEPTEVDELNQSERGSFGWGSTGK